MTNGLNPTRGREAIERDLYWARHVAAGSEKPEQRERARGNIARFEKELEDFNATQ